MGEKEMAVPAARRRAQVNDRAEDISMWRLREGDGMRAGARVPK
jgi:hypothetical protein